MASYYDDGRRPLRTWAVSVLSTIAGSALSLLPFVAQSAVWPAFGLLVALGWRMLRPEMWGAWVALPLGLIDDLIGGAPLGTSAALWTITFLAMDLADHRRVWRDLAVDWQLAAVAILFVTAGAWAIAVFSGGAGPLWTVAPQALLGALLFPAAMRVCAALDRWRLGKGAATTF